MAEEVHWCLDHILWLHQTALPQNETNQFWSKFSYGTLRYVNPYLRMLYQLIIELIIPCIIVYFKTG